MSHSRLLFVQTLSPLHCGTGQSIGAVDLPIARESSTALPLIPGSSFKGALRSVGVDTLKDKEVVELFGPESSDEERDHAGGISFGDARLLALPVRALRGTFAWVTSPLLLSRLAQDCQVSGLTPPPIPHSAQLMRGVDRCYVCSTSALRPDGEKSVYFEDLDLNVEPSNELDQLADWLKRHLFQGMDVWQEMIKARLCVVSDDILMFFAQNAMEVTTRVALEHETKTVKKGQLWTEEALPSESLLVSLCAPTAGRSGVSREALWGALDQLTAQSVQIGGNATVGQGRCRLVLSGGEA